MFTRNNQPRSRAAHRRHHVEQLEPRRVLSAEPVINEILAVNDGILQDEDGAFSDVIELYNAGDEPVDLDGWHLTDDVDELSKWEFPAVELEVGEYLLVFASGKDRSVAGEQLHTSFGLTSDGEYLALVEPDGFTVADALQPSFPQQFENVSYGIAADVLGTAVVDIGSSVDVLLPPDDALGIDWTERLFAPDGAWQPGELGVGYATLVAGPAPETVLQIDFNDRNNAINTLPGFEPFTIEGSGIQGSPVSRPFGAIDVTVFDVGGSGYDDRVRDAPNDAGLFTEGQLLQDFIFSRSTDEGGGLDVLLEGLTANATYTLTAWSFDMGSRDLRVSDWSANGIVAIEDYGFDGNATPTSNDMYQFAVVVDADANGEILLSGRFDPASPNFAVFINALRLERGDSLNPPAGISDVLRLDFNDRTNGEFGINNTEAGYSTMTLDENGAVFGDVQVTLSPFGAASLDDRDRAGPIDDGEFTLDQLYDDFVFSLGPNGSGMEILIEGLAPNAEYDLAMRSYDAIASAGVRESTWTEESGADPVVIAAPFAFESNTPPTSNNDLVMRATLTSSPQGTLLVRGVETGASPRVGINAIELTRAQLDGLIGLDVQAQMEGQHSDLYLRAEFDQGDVAAVDQLLLDMQYDAGFVAYLNGQEVARRNASTPAGVPPGANSIATVERTLSETIAVETFDLTSVKHLLVNDANVLAIHGMNSDSADDDFLIAPRLRAVELDGHSHRYFETPTLGAANNVGVLDFVEAVQASVEHGFFVDPFELTLTTSAPGAAIYYTYDGSVPSPSNPAATLYDQPLEIDATTVLRSAAYQEDFGDSPVATQTYIFLEDVLTQDPRSGPNASDYPATWQANATGDYAVDPEVVAEWDDDNPANTDYGIREALTSLPTMSIVLDHDDLWNANSGIYPNATSKGSAWRRPGSIEYFDPATGEQFQYNVGVQMHGSASRDNVRLKKHSFRLVFKSEFDGPGTLRFPLFDNSDFDDINTVVMRASFTDAFATRTASGRYSPLDSTYTRDVFMRDTQLAMGSHSPDSTFVHLYINGLYWGMYSPAERTDDAFLASRIGGEREDWDIVRDFDELYRGSKATWNQMFSLADQIAAASPTQADALFQQMQGRNPDGSPNGSYPPLLDVDNFIDYMILHLHAGVEDWPSHNWVAARNHVDPGLGFQFFTWDQEISYDGRFRDRTEATANRLEPGELFVELRNSSEFRLRFADRVQKHMFNDGALTVPANQERWQQRADQVEQAIIGESARWGDAREGEFVNVPPSTVIPVMTVDHWRQSIAEVRNDYFPQHHSLALSRFANDGLIPSLDAPQFNQHGGAVLPGFELSIDGAPPGGEIYFTLDGVDPRLVGGGVNTDSAVQFSDDIVISESATVMARVLDNGQWSPVTQATFTIAPGEGAIVISEINYHPHDPSSVETAAVPGIQADDFDFIEILNAHPTDSINLLNMSLSDGVTFTFGNTSLAPGQRAVVVEDIVAFEARYGTDRNVAGQWSGGLNNNGETLQLLDGLGGALVEFSYDDSDPWTSLADGDGATLELIDSGGTPAEQFGKYYHWRASTEWGGSPGEAGVGSLGAVINEVLAHTDQPDVDAIELFNPTVDPIDVGGWFLSDSAANLLKFEIAPGTTLDPNQHLVFDEHDFNPTPETPAPHHFSLNGAAGDEVYLVVPDGAGGVSQIVDFVEFGGSANGESFGRAPDGSSRLTPLVHQSLEAANGSPRVGPLVITEVNYHPESPAPAALAIDPTLGDNDLEFVEILNPSGATINLTDWRLRGEADFDFSPGTSIAAGATLVLVPFDPDDPLNEARRDAFRVHYGINAAVPLAGGLRGNLNNSFGVVRLERPDEPPDDDPLFIPRITVDELLYDDLAPWPTAVDGGGSSLTRAGLTLYGNDAASWLASNPTPGTVALGASADFDQNGLVDGTDFLAWQRGFGASPAIHADGDADRDQDVDQVDLNIWELQFGQSLSATISASASSEPETLDAAMALAGESRWLVTIPGRRGFRSPPGANSLEWMSASRDNALVAANDLHGESAGDAAIAEYVMSPQPIVHSFRPTGDRDASEKEQQPDGWQHDKAVDEALEGVFGGIFTS